MIKVTYIVGKNYIYFIGIHMHQVRTLLYLSVCFVDWSALEKIKDNDL